MKRADKVPEIAREFALDLHQQAEILECLLNHNAVEAADIEDAIRECEELAEHWRERMNLTVYNDQYISGDSQEKKTNKGEKIMTDKITNGTTTSTTTSTTTAEITITDEVQSLAFQLAGELLQTVNKLTACEAIDSVELMKIVQSLPDIYAGYEAAIMAVKNADTEANG